MITRQQKDAWTAALRSGKYTQGSGCLSRGRSYCCLGVLEKIDYSVFRLNSLNLHTDALPGSIQAKLTYKNDSLKLSFAKIADYIDENYDKWVAYELSSEAQSIGL